MINAVSLFSNVGIGETYLGDIGINVCIGNELIKNRCDFHKYLYPNCKMICGDITEELTFNQVLNEAKQINCDLLIATPPCQGMSTAGMMKQDDFRNSLIMYAIKFAQNLKPKYILFENVPQQKTTQLLYNGNLEYIPEIVIKELGELYNIKYDILNASDYGVAQTRKRLIFIMTRKDTKIKWEFPEKSNKIVTVRDAIGDLPSFEAIVKNNEKVDCDFFYKNIFNSSKQVHKWHKPTVIARRYIEAMLHTPTGKSAFSNEYYYPRKINGEKMKGFMNTFKRMDWDRPSPTITMQSGNIGSQENGHPGRPVGNGIYSDARVLSILEIMRLMSLPDDWNIPEWASEKLIRDVIGEGIPPLMLKEIFNNLIKEINYANK